MLDLDALAPLLRAALAEDIGPGDITSELLVPEDRRAVARVRAKAEGVVAGVPVAAALFQHASGGEAAVRVAVEDPYDLTRLDAIKAMNLAPRCEFLVGLRDDILGWVRASYGETGPVQDEADLGRIILDLGTGEDIGKRRCPERNEARRIPGVLAAFRGRRFQDYRGNVAGSA